MDDELERRLAFVPPARRALVQSRIAVLEQHLRIESPTLADADRAAAVLGMTRVSFYRLLRAWKTRRDPLAVGIQGPPHNRGRRPHAGDTFVEQMLEKLPPGRPIDRDVTAIMMAARREGITVRAHNGLFAMVRDLRSPKGAEGLFIDHVIIKFPVEGPDYPMMPTASVLGHGASGKIHAVKLSLDIPGQQTVVGLLRHARDTGVAVSAGPTARTVLAFDIDMDHDWGPMLDVLASHGIDREGENRKIPHGGKFGQGLVFPTLFDLNTMTRSIGRPADRRRAKVQDGLDEVLSIEKAQSFIDMRVAAERPERPVAIADDLDGLLAELDQVRPV